MNGNPYGDDPTELLQLYKLVHEEHHRTWCHCGPTFNGFEVELGPEQVILQGPGEAQGLWDVLPDDTELRSFKYAVGATCPNCGEDLSERLALYGPPEDDDGPVPLTEYRCYAD